MAEMSQPEALVWFLESLRSAAAASHALAHMQQRPAWLTVRDNLESIRTMGAQLATMSATPRKDVLEQLDRRRLRVVK